MPLMSPDDDDDGGDDDDDAPALQRDGRHV